MTNLGVIRLHHKSYILQYSNNVHFLHYRLAQILRKLVHCVQTMTKDGHLVDIKELVYFFISAVQLT